MPECTHGCRASFALIDRLGFRRWVRGSDRPIETRSATLRILRNRKALPSDICDDVAIHKQVREFSYAGQSLV